MAHAAARRHSSTVGSRVTRTPTVVNSKGPTRWRTCGGTARGILKPFIGHSFMHDVQGHAGTSTCVSRRSGAPGCSYVVTTVICCSNAATNARTGACSTALSGRSVVIAVTLLSMMIEFAAHAPPNQVAERELLGLRDVFKGAPLIAA